MASDPAPHQYQLGVTAVREFFGRYYGDNVHHVDACDDAGEELVLFSVGNMRKTVAVTADFLTLSENEIFEKLAAWNIAHLSRTLERNCRLKITGDGPEEERD